VRGCLRCVAHRRSPDRAYRMRTAALLLLSGARVWPPPVAVSMAAATNPERRCHAQPCPWRARWRLFLRSWVCRRWQSTSWRPAAATARRSAGRACGHRAGDDHRDGCVAVCRRPEPRISAHQGRLWPHRVWHDCRHVAVIFHSARQRSCECSARQTGDPVGRLCADRLPCRRGRAVAIFPADVRGAGRRVPCRGCGRRGVFWQVPLRRPCLQARS